MWGGVLEPKLRGEPDPKAVGELVGIWAKERSGRLTADGVAGSARLHGGRVADREGLAWVADALVAGGLEFSAAQPLTFPPDPQELAPLLMAAGRRLAGDFSIAEKLDLLLVDGSLIELTARLPLGRETRRLLRSSRQQDHTLRRTLSVLRVGPGEVEADLQALFGLRFVLFRAPPSLRRRALGGRVVPVAIPPRQAPPTAPEPPDPEAAARAEQAEAAARRLAGERRALERCDDWTLLGIAPDAPREAVLAACDRLTGRYDAQVDDPLLSRSARADAAWLQRRLAEAIERVKAARPALAPPPHMPDASTAARLGRAAVSRHDFAAAARWFALAHQQQRDEPLYLALYAWSMHKDPRRSPEHRLVNARALSLQAALMDLGNVACRLLLVEVAAGCGELSMAREHLQAVLDKHPGHPRAQVLLAQLNEGEG